MGGASDGGRTRCPPFRRVAPGGGLCEARDGARWRREIAMQPTEAARDTAEARRAAALKALRELHAEVDQSAARLERAHAGRLQCRRGCSGCCIDELRVFEIEAENIRDRHGALLQAAEPHAKGACAFLDAAGSCRIYADRPYVCRTQGLPLRWFEDPEGRGDAVEHRDICVLNIEGPPLESLPAAVCWEIGPVEARLAELESRYEQVSGDAAENLRRVELRSLFVR